MKTLILTFEELEKEVPELGRYRGLPENKSVLRNVNDIAIRYAENVFNNGDCLVYQQLFLSGETIYFIFRIPGG